jgi:hypothetical protein
MMRQERNDRGSSGSADVLYMHQCTAVGNSQLLMPPAPIGCKSEQLSASSRPAADTVAASWLTTFKGTQSNKYLGFSRPVRR